MDYGGGITRPGLLDFAPKLKSRIIASHQEFFLSTFEMLTRWPPLDKWFSRISRRLTGGFLYSVKVEVNTACMLNCEMCYIREHEKELPLEIVLTLLDDIKDCHVRLEILGGEPLIRRDLEEMIRYAKFKSHVPLISIYTNGLEATKERSSGLKAAGLDVAIVTLISHEKDVHDAFTGMKGSWDRTVENIVNLREAGITTYTFTAVHRKNYRDVRKIYNFVKNQLMVDPLFYQYIPQRKNDPLLIDSHDWDKIKHWVLVEKNPEHAEFVRKFYMLTGNACSGGNFVFTVKADGSVQPCPFLTEIPLGNIYQESIWKIYKHRFRSGELKNFKSLPPECTDCGYKSVCFGGCRAGNNLVAGGWCTRDIRCLGPYREPIHKEEVVDKVPSFF
ncbi:MAG: radical SAM protein [Calditrichia bacterium]